MNENNEETSALQEMRDSVQQTRAGVVRTLLVARLRDIARQSKVGVIGGFAVFLAGCFGVLALVLDLLPVSVWFKLAIGLVLFLLSVYGAFGLLRDAGVI